MNTVLNLVRWSAAAAVLVMCVLAAYTDLKRRIIPDIYPLLISVCGLADLVVSFLMGDADITDFVLAFAGAVLGFAVTALSGVIIKNGIGGGDIKLVTALCFCFGLRRSFGFMFYSVLAAGICGLFLIIIKKKSRSTMIPFAPFVLIGVVGAFIAGCVS